MLSSHTGGWSLDIGFWPGRCPRPGLGHQTWGPKKVRRLRAPGHHSLRKVNLRGKSQSKSREITLDIWGGWCSRAIPKHVWGDVQVAYFFVTTLIWLAFNSILCRQDVDEWRNAHRTRGGRCVQQMLCLTLSPAEALNCSDFIRFGFLVRKPPTSFKCLKRTPQFFFHMP